MRELSLNIDNHTTTIRIGSELLSNIAGIRNRKVIVLLDVNVFKHHKDKFQDMNTILIPSGEKYKCLAYAEEVMRKLVDMEADRTTFIVGAGGGLVTDLAGFIASTFMRGVEFGFISTTLLGQVDASIGGKNGVNLDGYKNMIGVIRQPEFVWCDLDLLESLSQKELLSGFAEVIKYGAIRDKDLFVFLEKNYHAILSRENQIIERIAGDSADIKVSIVESDVTEQGDRKLLNFGHTLGHAIEKVSGMLHGEAIAIGMVLAAELSVRLGFLEKSNATRLKQLIEESGLPVETNIKPEVIYSTLLKDKKRSGNHMQLILLKSLGEAFIHSLDLETLKNEINDLY